MQFRDIIAIELRVLNLIRRFLSALKGIDV